MGHKADSWGSCPPYAVCPDEYSDSGGVWPRPRVAVTRWNLKGVGGQTSGRKDFRGFSKNQYFGKIRKAPVHCFNK
ncbi:hypothetical protein HMPREF0322_01226 [Desulfitobacterium hafniense DP7]|uniref:Uncharacterized protein n=1 Tax=Desulfitobacterium hafniense DP7 TaxID=537010 RepID=G9XJU5_DESHA|nr:hypothetical protein HMPREF0322_01226 [Desulfitobacterium hafniense DP7]